MEEKYQKIISALQEEIRVLKEELAQTRELLKEKVTIQSGQEKGRRKRCPERRLLQRRGH